MIRMNSSPPLMCGGTSGVVQLTISCPGVSMLVAAGDVMASVVVTGRGVEGMEGAV
jgi:hypothetical protein